jgi:hypothetical protein
MPRAEVNGEAALGDRSYGGRSVWALALEPSRVVVSFSVVTPGLCAAGVLRDFPDGRNDMFATIRSYHGVEQTRTAELTDKVNETLTPMLKELPGFEGYYLVDAGNGLFTSLSLFTTREQGEASTTLVSKWIRDEKFDTLLPNEPKIMSGNVVAHVNERVLVA